MIKGLSRPACFPLITFYFSLLLGILNDKGFLLYMYVCMYIVNSLVIEYFKDSASMITFSYYLLMNVF